MKGKLKQGKERKMKKVLKKRNDMKGITLIALVITIIVLLILAGVSIATLTGENGILTQANEAKEVNQKAGAEEKVGLEVQGSYDETGKINIETLNDNLKNIEGLTHSGGRIEDNPISKLPATVVVDGNNITIKENGSVVLSEWQQTGYQITNGEITLNVGDVVNYNELSNGSKNSEIKTEESGYETKQELGENGGIELISDNPTSTKVSLSGETGYLNAEEVLNIACNELYGNGEYAESARSLNRNDINKLANYNPETDSEYGNLYKYRFSTEEGCMQYSKLAKNEQEWSEWVNITNEQYQTFKMPGQLETDRISKDNPKESEVIKDTYQGSLFSISSDENIDNMIMKGTEENNVSYWIANSIVSCANYIYVDFRLGYVWNGMVGAYLLYNASGYPNSNGYAVRPVVTLESNIQLEGNSEDGWTIK